MLNKNKTKIKSITIFILVIISISIFLAFGIIEGAKDILGLKSKDVNKEVFISKGASTYKIAKILKENEIIKYPTLFRIYSKIKNTDSTYRNGKYNLNSKMSYQDIIYIFQSMTERTDVVRVTIPEGLTVNQIAGLLKDKKVCKSKQDFLDAVDNCSYTSKALAKIKDDDMVRFKLEGYLFPDTYDFIIDSKSENVINIMLQNFDNKVFDYLNKEIEKSELNFSEVITLASIVQKESTNFDIMKTVSSVFLNRLNNKSKYPKLQSDVTILYVEESIKPNLQMKNQKLYDSYNTYVCSGLPVGPICNPGLDAIKAVLSPDVTDYNYFLTDANDNYYWAKTLQEHNNNLYKASKVGKVQGVDTE